MHFVYAAHFIEKAEPDHKHQGLLPWAGEEEGTGIWEEEMMIWCWQTSVFGSKCCGTLKDQIIKRARK